jgi:nitrate reductase NapE
VTSGAVLIGDATRQRAQGMSDLRADCFRGGLPMTTETSGRSARTNEIVAFLLLMAVLMPIFAVGVVGGYGFAVWTWQRIAGPPGPPNKG